MLTVEVEETAGSTVTLSVSGEVDSFNANELRDAFSGVAQAQAVVVDLRGVPFMDSAGLGALVCGIRRIRMAGGSVVLCAHRRGGVFRLLSVTGVDRIVTLVSSPEEGQEALIAAAAPV